MSDLEEKYRLDYFEEHEMVRRECASCGDHFWTRDHDRRVCGEPQDAHSRRTISCSSK